MNNNSSQLSRLRAEAEAILGRRSITESVLSTAEELRHELHVYQVELEMQNEELWLSQGALEASRDRYAEIFDHAPAGHILLTQQGLITEINLTAVELIGLDREKLLSSRFARLVTAKDGDRWYLFFTQLITHNKSLNIELSLKRSDNTEISVRLDCQYVNALLHITLIDITQMKQAEQLAISLAREKTREEVLKHFEKIFARLPGMAYQYYLRADGSSYFPYVSAGIADIYRLNPDQVRQDATPVFAALHPDDYDGFVASIQQSAQDFTPWRHGYRIKFDDGTVRKLYGDAVPDPQRDADGGLFWHGFITDITEQKTTPKAAELSGKCILVVEDNLINQQVTEEFLKLCGADVDIANNGQEALQRLEPHRYDAVLMDIQMPVMSGIEATEQIRKQSQYKNLPIIAVSAGVTDENRADCLACGMNDFLPKPLVPEDLVHRLKIWIAKSKHKVAATIVSPFEAQNFTLTSILCAISQSIIITDKNRRIIYANPANTVLTGYTPENLFGKSCSLLQGAESDPRVIGLMSDALNAAQSFNGQILNYRKDGSMFWNELAITPLFDAGGKLTNFISIQKDITAFKQLHGIMRDSEERLRAKTEFLATMSHEIRTPINSIIGLTKLAINQSDSFKLYDYLLKIDSSSNTLLAILNDILDFSKLEAGKFSIESTTFSLNTLLDNLQALFSSSAQEKGIDFSVELAAAVPIKLLGDPLRLQQILSNLISNAIKFTASGEVRLTISLLAMESARARIHFSVIDTGIGISKQYVSNLLLPFEQLDSSTSRLFGGTGLGLSISNSLLKLMGGNTMQIDSIVDQGSCFSFELLLGVAVQQTLPVVDRRMTERRTGNLSLKLRDLGQGLSGKRVLLAEDDRINQQVIKEFLAICGVHVDVASNGEVVLQLLEQHRYDVILMDVHMPVMGGMEATKRIRMNPKYKILPIIALSAGVTETERANCISGGMDGFVPKPIVTEELIRVLKALFDKNKSPSSVDEIVQTACEQLSPHGFELDGMLAMVGGNNALLAKLLHDFREDCEATGLAIERYFKDNDIAAVQQLLHKLKGASGVVGIKKLYAASEELEASLKQSQLNQELYVYFQKILSETIVILARY